MKGGFSDVNGEVEFKPYQYLDLEGNVTWSQENSVYKSYDAILTVSDKRGDSAMVDYRYTRGTRRSILYEIFISLFGGVSGYWKHERDMWNGWDVRSEVGVRYESQCWSLGVTYTHEMLMHRREYFFEIGFHGLGEFGMGRYAPEKPPSWKRIG